LKTLTNGKSLGGTQLRPGAWRSGFHPRHRSQMNSWEPSASENG